MLTSGIPELSSSKTVQYVNDVLLPEATAYDAEATIAFTRSVYICSYIIVYMQLLHAMHIYVQVH